MLLLGVLLPPPAITVAQDNTLSLTSYSNTQLQLFVNGPTNCNGVIQVNTNVTTATWTSIWTNAVPCTFTDTVSPYYPTRFYRALYLSKAQNYAVHFLGNSSDPISTTAGVAPLSGWNNISNETFTTGSITSCDGSQTAALTLSGPVRPEGGVTPPGTGETHR